MCALDGGETYAVFNAYTRRAAKAHTCGECGRIIERGETYRYSRGLYDGSWNTNHICAHCTVAAEWLTVNCHGYLDNGVLSDFEEHAFEYPALATDILPIAEGMRRKWRAENGLMPVPVLPPSIASVIGG